MQFYRELKNRLPLFDFTRESVLRITLESVVFRGAGLSLAFLIQIYITRLLGPEGRGQYSSFLAIVAIGTQLLSLGLQGVNTRVIAGEKKSLSPIVTFSLIYSFILLFTSLVICTQIEKLEAFTNGASKDLMSLSIVTIPFSLAFLLLNQVLLGLKSYRLYNLSEIVSKIFFFAFLAFSYNIFKDKIFWALGSNLFALSIGSIFIVSILWKNFSCKFQLNYQIIKSNIGYSWRLYLSSLFSLLLIKQDILILQYLKDFKVTGLYSASSSLCDLIYVLPSIVGSIYFPKLAEFTDKKLSFSRVKRSTGYLGLLMFMIVGVAFILAPFILSIVYGSAFSGAVLSFRILLIAIFLFSLNNLFSVYISVNSNPWITVLPWGGACLLNLILNFILIPRFNEVGASITSVISYSFVLTCNYYLARKISND